MNHYIQKIEDALDKHFPKGECKERGAALMLFAEACLIIRELIEAEIERKRGMRKYSGKHNSAHTWIENGYCHACKANLTPKQLEEEFGYNSAIDEDIAYLESQLALIKKEI